MFERKQVHLRHMVNSAVTRVTFEVDFHFISYYLEIIRDSWINVNIHGERACPKLSSSHNKNFNLKDFLGEINKIITVTRVTVTIRKIGRANTKHLVS